MMLDGSTQVKHVAQNLGLQTSENFGSYNAVKELMKEKMRTNYSIDFASSNKWKENNKTGSSHLKIKKGSVGEDLTKFLNFYNKSTYMSVAKTMGQKLQYNYTSKGSTVRINEILPKDAYISPRAVRMNQFKEKIA
jgi:hypothetical protein